MRRSIIICICVFNGTLACGLLWYVLATPDRAARLAGMPSQAAEIDALSDAELWSRASASANTREAMRALSQIQDRDFFLGSSGPQLTRLRTSNAPSADEWFFLQALIQVYAAKAESTDELTTLAEIAVRGELPLTLRDSAFRALVENAQRFADKEDFLDKVFTLIDSTHAEPNSLSLTALQAEFFLVQRGIKHGDRDTLFQDRLVETLRDSDQPDDKRITALNILAAIDGLGTIPIEEVYLGADEPVRTAILRSLSQAKSSVSNDWLGSIRPTTPEQEQLLLQIPH